MQRALLVLQRVKLLLQGGRVNQQSHHSGLYQQVRPAALLMHAAEGRPRHWSGKQGGDLR